jgi:valyl-tRNA synthetase
VESLETQLRQLAGIAEISWLGDNKAPAAATALCGELEILVPLADLIDRDAELQRLNKEIARLEADVLRLGAKLENESFVAKAPEAVVAKEREKLAAQRAALDKLQAQTRHLNE